jgi:hypothetical protein
MHRLPPLLLVVLELTPSFVARKAVKLHPPNTDYPRFKRGESMEE